MTSLQNLCKDCDQFADERNDRIPWSTTQILHFLQAETAGPQRFDRDLTRTAFALQNVRGPTTVLHISHCILR